jgi:hypothetical protein
MGCSCCISFGNKPYINRRSSVSNRYSIDFTDTKIEQIDDYFNYIKQFSASIIQNIQALRIAKTVFYYKLCLPSLFSELDTTRAYISLVLYLIANGYKIEFTDSCPFLEVNNENDIYKSYLAYVESLHHNIIALNSIKPDLQEQISKGKEFFRRASFIADEEGFDFPQKLNAIGIMISNFKVLWKLPSKIENRIWSVKKDLFGLKEGMRKCLQMSVRFSLLYNTTRGLGPEDTLRKIWHDQDQLK